MPPAGFEPAQPAPEAGALSPELRGRRTKHTGGAPIASLVGSTGGNSGSAATAGLQRLVPMIPDPLPTEVPYEEVPTPAAPSRRGPLPAHLLPLTAEVGSEGRLRIGGVDILELVEEVGTPVFVYDEEHLRRRCREARPAFGPGVAYASKAFLCRAMAALAYEEGMCIDVSTGGELAVALAAGVPGERLVLHGNNKSEAELEAALGGRRRADRRRLLRRDRPLARVLSGRRDPGRRQASAERPGPGDARASRPTPTSTS